MLNSIDWLVPLIALIAAVPAERWLPRGFGAGLFVSGLSALLLRLNATVDNAEAAGFLLAAILASVGILWMLVAIWIERGGGLPTAPDSVDPRVVRRTFAIHAAGMAVAAALAVIWFGKAAPTYVGVMLLLVVAVAVAATIRISAGLLIARTAMWASIAAIGVVLLSWHGAAAQAGDVVLLACGAGALLLFLLIILFDWRRRIAVWHSDPRRLVEPPPKHRFAYGLVLMIAILVAVAGVVLRESILTPFAIWLAAYAVLGIGHRAQSDTVGELGLAMIVLVPATAGTAWLPASPANSLIGTALGGALMLWLARFWSQQLNDGRPWTTTGRLIPAARRIGCAVVGLEVFLATTWVFDERAAAAGWQAVPAVLFLFLHGSMLIRDAKNHRDPGIALAGCAAMLALAVPLHGLIVGWGATWSLGAVVGIVAMLIAIRGGAAVTTTWPTNAYLAAILPGVVVLGCAHGVSAQSCGIGLGGVLLAWCWRLSLSFRARVG